MTLSITIPSNVWRWFKNVAKFLGILALTLWLMGGTSCGPKDVVSMDQALIMSGAEFVDITSAGGCTQFLPKEGGIDCVTSSPISVWYVNQRLTFCTHLTDDNGYTSKFVGCDYYTPPQQIASPAKLVGINQGAAEVTQTVWNTPLGLQFCNHSDDWLDDTQIRATTCGQLPRPNQLSSSATLLTVNSGYRVKSQEFWLDKGQTWVCTVATWKLPSGLRRPFGRQAGVQQCTPYQYPDNKADGMGDLILVGINSDEGAPWEFFFVTTYQGRGVYAVRCIYNYSQPGWDDQNNKSNYEENFTDQKEQCAPWFGLKNSYLPAA